MKTLFVTDLDGTLLKENKLVSKDSINIINSLMENGLCFSYATARSYYSASIVTDGLICSAPIITKNGVFISDSRTGEIIVKNIFSEDESENIYNIIRGNGLQPIVYSYQDGREIKSFDETNVSEGIQWYLDEHKYDKRICPLCGDKNILSGDIHYFSCLGTREMLEDTYNEIRKKYRCVFSKDTYENIMWLEIMPQKATKADAVSQLKEMCGCDYLVVFGDGLNDISMFRVADEGYAVQNAVEELKEIATEVIGSNRDDGVAGWLQKNYIV